MSFSIATATNFEDLFLKIEAFLTAQGHAHGKRFSGVGTGNLIAYQGKAASVAQTITCTATSATSFSVVGSVSGSLGTATVGTPFTSAQIDFTITAGGTAYVAGDVWTISITPPWTLSRPFNGAWRNDVTNVTNVNINSPAVNTVSQIRCIRPIEIREVSFNPQSSSASTPTAFTVEWSDNGSAWTAATSFSALTAGWTIGIERRFTVPASGAHRWWRLRYTAYNSTVLSASEVNFYDVAGSGASYSTRFPWMAVRSPGNDGLLQGVFHSLEARDIPGTDTYNLLIYPHTSYSALSHADTQLGRGGAFASIPAANLAMNYWFVANGRRFAMGLKVSTVYFGAYMGLMLPYARPSAYPLPWFLGGGSLANNTRWSDTNASPLNVFAKAIDQTALAGQAEVRGLDGNWRNVAAFNGANQPVLSAAVGRMYPHQGTGGSTNGGLQWMRENFGGGYPLLPLIPTLLNGGALGELDGCFWTTGFGQAAENVITLNRQDHIVMQNVFRTTAGDYWALRMD